MDIVKFSEESNEIAKTLYEGVVAGDTEVVP